MNQIIFDRLAALYGTVATEVTIRNAVVHGYLTAAQYEQITGSIYEA